MELNDIINFLNKVVYFIDNFGVLTGRITGFELVNDLVKSAEIKTPLGKKYLVKIGEIYFTQSQIERELIRRIDAEIARLDYIKTKLKPKPEPLYDSLMRMESIRNYPQRKKRKKP